MSLRFQIADLLASPGEAREESARLVVSIELPSASVDGEVDVELKMRSLTDGVIVRGDLSAEADLICNRCLDQWRQSIEVPFEQVFRLHPEDDDDELPIVDRSWIDLESVVHDELSLGLPLVPLCREDCQGLCPTCGTDLNVQPCGGHGEESDSPFAPLRDLFDS
jgi:uncharacterized protein